ACPPQPSSSSFFTTSPSMSRSFLPLILSTSARIFSVVSNTWPHLMEQFKAGLIEGQNITIDYRFAEGDIERMQEVDSAQHRQSLRRWYSTAKPFGREPQCCADNCAAVINVSVPAHRRPLVRFAVARLDADSDR